MSNWKKTSLQTSMVILVILAAVLYFFNINISFPSQDLKFSPAIQVDVPQELLVERPKNIILFIADGMGFSHLSLALQTLQQEDEIAVWHRFGVKGWHDARSAYGPLTDSEASATAMATGRSTNFGHIGLDVDGQPLQNVFEVASEHEYNTGIVTDSYVWDGTPAAFSAHIRNEDDARNILKQLAASDLDLLFGELEDVGEDDVPELEESMAILQERFFMLDATLELPMAAKSDQPIAAIFMEDEIQDMDSSPNLYKLTQTALSHLCSREAPFVLLVESEEMDAASHENDSQRVIKGLAAIQATLSLVLDMAKEEGETLVLFTADHETGGLAAVADFDRYPELQIRWATKEHSAAVVPVFAHGPGAEFFANINRNWEIGQRLKQLIIGQPQTEAINKETNGS